VQDIVLTSGNEGGAYQRILASSPSRCFDLTYACTPRFLNTFTEQLSIMLAPPDSCETDLQIGLDWSQPIAGVTGEVKKLMSTLPPVVDAVAGIDIAAMLKGMGGSSV
jgi:hypothetical protein